MVCCHEIWQKLIILVYMKVVNYRDANNDVRRYELGDEEVRVA